MKLSLHALLAIAAICVLHAEDKPKAPETAAKPPVVKTEDEWKKLLTDEQYAVTRQRGTERPFGAIYEEFEKQGEGTYYCVCCGAELFTSKEKFHSGCGWPSFYAPTSADAVELIEDRSLAPRIRVEVRCAKCGSHMGHVFEGEGYDVPTDQRWCINSVSLVLEPK